MQKRIWALAVTLALCLSLLPMSALATEGETEEPEYVAQITAEGVTAKFKILDAAVSAAKDGDTIELLKDCTTEGMNLDKSLTIQAAEELEQVPTVTFTKEGIALWGKSLTFKNCHVVMDGIGSTPYSEWNWMAICASKDASLTLDNTNMAMDGTDAGNAHAIYFCSNNKLNLINGACLTITDYPQDALEWDGGDGGYNVTITDSTFVSDHNRSGFTGTFYAVITNSKVDVGNSTGNGSNGSHFILIDSTVNFRDNGAHGLSAGILTIENSKVNASGNGANGIHTNNVLTIRNGAEVTVKDNDCSISSKWTVPGAMHISGGDASIDSTSVVTIQDNKGSGILLKSGSLTVEEGANLTITNNTADKLGYGGGIHNRGVMALPANLVLYNNHAGIAGDDLYNENENASLTFGPVGSGWQLDGDKDRLDCGGVRHDIDNWYDDGENSRWEAHAKPLHVVGSFGFSPESGTATARGPLALKAAHALIPVEPHDPEPGNWTVSKSKSATNLDGNYTSQVTLSLPSAEETLVTDVVFVLDKSTSADLEDQALAMLQSLKEQVEETDAKVKIGVVIFNKVANVANEGNFFDLSSEYDAIQAAIQEKHESGTNTHASLLAGKAMLDNDTGVDASRKYLIFVSDGITYMYNQIPTATAWSFWADAWATWASPDNWKSKMGDNEPPADWSAWMTDIGAKVEAQGTEYEYPYNGTVTKATPQDDTWNIDWANSIDKALYLTHQVYQEAQEEGYHCYAMIASQNNETPHIWGPSFMEWLADGQDVSFDTIQNDIYHLLSADSQVVDYMGYAENDYNFDLVNDPAALTLKVGGETYSAVKLAENQYGFCPNGKDGDKVGYDYTLTYVPEDGKATEHFRWDINVPVSNFAPVSLTYSVKLTGPKTTPGTYGAYDQYGANHYAGLYTNNSATLYPVDSNGQQGIPEVFAKPTVSYTVQSAGGGGSSGGGKPPVLNTKDHYSYIIGYPVDYYTGEKSTDQTVMPVKPEGSITRAEVATIFFRMLTDESRNEHWGQISGYADVEQDDWFNNAVCTLTNAGILQGYRNGTFQPNGKITRAEFAAIASRFFEYPDKTIHPPFSDVPEDAWYCQFILAASDQGLINGYPDGTFQPNSLITRAEACAIVNRTLDRHPDQEHFLKDMLVWVDNMDTGKWYYADMQEATNSHTYQCKTDSDGKYEIWIKLLPVRDWAAFETAWSNANSAAGGEVIK